MKFYVRLNDENSIIFDKKIETLLEKSDSMGIEQYILERERNYGVAQGVDLNQREVIRNLRLEEKFSIEKVHKGGAKFDYEKAKWFNHEWIKKLPASHYSQQVKSLFTEKGIDINDDEKFLKVLDLVKERCTLLPDFVQQASFFFKAPTEIDVASIKPKWNEDKALFFDIFCEKLTVLEDWTAPAIETLLKDTAVEKNIKPGELQLPFRIMLVGGKFGPPVVDIAETIGKAETIGRIRKAITDLV